MPATRHLKEFKVRTTTGEIVTIHRRCFGSGRVVQKHLDKLLYDEETKKFRTPPKEDRNAATAS